MPWWRLRVALRLPLSSRASCARWLQRMRARMRGGSGGWRAARGVVLFSLECVVVIFCPNFLELKPSREPAARREGVGEDVLHSETETTVTLRDQKRQSVRSLHH